MSSVIDERNMNCFAVDEDTACLQMGDRKYIVDYSSLMDFIIRLTVVAAQIENHPTCSQGQCRQLEFLN